jgi:hypothetical protein
MASIAAVNGSPVAALFHEAAHSTIPSGKPFKTVGTQGGSEKDAED